MEYIVEIKGQQPLPTYLAKDKKIELNLTIGELTRKIQNLHKIKDIYVFVTPPDLSCGFLPLPNQTIEELLRLYGNENNKLNLVCSYRIYQG